MDMNLNESQVSVLIEKILSGEEKYPRRRIFMKLLINFFWIMLAIYMCLTGPGIVAGVPVFIVGFYFFRTWIKVWKVCGYPSKLFSIIEVLCIFAFLLGILFGIMR